MDLFLRRSLYRLHVEHLCIYIQDEQWQAATTDLVSELKSVSAASEQQLSHLTENMEKHGQEVESWMINAEEEMTKLRAQGAEALAVQMDLIAQIDIMKKGSKELRYKIAIGRHMNFFTIHLTPYFNPIINGYRHI